MPHVHFRILLSVVGYLTTTTLWLCLREHTRSGHLVDILFIAATSFLLALALHAYSRREAIANARLYRTSQEQRSQLEALFRTTDSIMAGLDLPTTLRHIVEGAAAIARCEHIKLLLLDPDTQTLRLELARGFQPPATFRLPVGSGLSGIVAATRKTLYVPNSAQDPRNVYAPIDRETHFRTYLGIPIIIRDEMVGVLSLNTVEPRTYSPEELTTYTLFANQAAIAIANARLHEATRKELADRIRAEEELRQSEEHATRLAQENATMAELGRILSSTLKIEDVYDSFAEAVRTILPFDRLVLNSINREKKLVRIVFIAGESPHDRTTADPHPLEGSSSAEMVRTRASLLIQTDDVRAVADRFPGLDSTFQAGFRSILTVPLFAKGEVIGGLLLRSRQRNAYTDRDVRLAERIASQIAGAVANAELYRENAQLFVAVQEELRNTERAQAALRQHTTQLEALRTVSTQITRDLDLPTTLRVITHALADLIQIGQAAVWLYDERQHTLMIGASTDPTFLPEGQRLGLEEGLVGHVATTRQGCIVNDYRRWPQARRVILDRTPITAAMAEPLCYQDRLIGVLTVDNAKTGEPFGPLHQATLRLFAQHAAIAIANARAHTAAIERSTQLAALLRATRSVMSGLNLPEILARIVEEAAQMAATRYVTLLLRDPAARVLRLAAQAGGSVPEGFAIPLGSDLSGQVAETGQPLFIADSPNDPRNLLAERDRALGLRTYLGLPVQTATDVLGVLTFETTTPRRYAPEELAYLTSFADQAAIAIENARLFQAEQERRRDLEAVRTVSTEITRELDLSVLLGLIIRRAVELVGAGGGVIYLWDKQEQMLDPGAWSGYEAWVGAVRRPLGDGVAGTIAQRREGMLVADYQHSPFANALIRERAGITAVLGEPLLYHERLLGVITVDNLGTDRSFSDQDRGHLALFATQAAIAIENARLYDALRNELGQRRQTQADLLASETRLRQLIDTANEGILTLDADATITSLNPKMASLLGYTPEELRGRNYFDLIVPEERADARAAWHHRSLGQVAQHERAFQRKTGSPCILLTSASPLFDAEGQFAGAFAMYADITARKAAEAALQQRMLDLEAARALTSEITRELQLPALLSLTLERVAALLRGTAASLYLWDATEQTLTRLAWTPEPEDLGPVRLRLGQGIVGTVAQARHGLIVNDYRSHPGALPEFLRNDRLIAILAEPLITRDHLIGVLAVCRDAPTFTEADATFVRLFASQIAIAIDNARLYEAQRQAYADLQRAQDELVRTEKLRALGQLAAGLAHDLNNSLSAIITQAELLQLRHSTTAFPELQALSTAAHDSAHIVWRLREFSRHQPTVALVPIRLASAVADALEITRPHWRDHAQRRGASIEITADLDSLPHVLGSPSEVREALTNLILNAVDAMPTGGALHFGGTTRPATPGTPPPVELVIQDTGCGIPEDIRQHIFDPFFSTKGPQGTGMGLAIVYRIMERLGGKISVASQPGRGTAFTLLFQGADPPEAAPSPPPLIRTTTPLRILVVEDNSHVRNPLVQILAAIGHTPLEATDPASALAHFAGVAPDLVITDLAMPGMNGIDLASAIRATHPQTPIILHTGWQDEPTLDAEVERGIITAVLEKPIDIRKLSAVIDQYGPPS